MPITYTHEPSLTAPEFREILIVSTLGARRPVDDLPRLDKMLRQADLIITARDGARLIGISRAVTDFTYCCYLSDLAVDVAHQHQGIGKRLIEETRARAGNAATLILLAAPAAEGYYPRIGLKQHHSCWTIPPAT